MLGSNSSMSSTYNLSKLALDAKSNSDKFAQSLCPFD